MMRRQTTAVVAIAALLVAVAACDDDGVTALPTPSKTIDLDPVLTVGLAEIGGSSVTGTTTIIDVAGPSSIVVVNLSGLAPMSEHAGHVHMGSCAAQGGVATPLQPITADANGDGGSVTADVPDSNLGPSFYVQYHEALSPPGPGIACGDIPQFGASGVTGTAQIFDDDGPVSTVVVSLSGLAPGTDHAGHVHTGACTAQGGVVTPLQPITADGAGRGTASTPNVPDGNLMAGFYIQYHEALSPPGPGIVCGDVQ
jgi:hypothetical protein